MKDVSVIILAAGLSRRYGTNKIFEKVNGIPVIVKSIVEFKKCKNTKEIIICTRKENFKNLQTICKEYNLKNIKIIEGGNKRSDSALIGFNNSNKSTKFIAIHDAARPNVTLEDIEKVIKNAKIYGASILGVPVKDTIKRVENNFVKNISNRSTLYIAQTPQVFRKDLYKQALDNSIFLKEEVTDDSLLLEKINCPVYLTLGSYCNIKITTEEDKAACEIINKK